MDKMVHDRILSILLEDYLIHFDVEELGEEVLHLQLQKVQNSEEKRNDLV
jgi:hypothetical protein